MTVRDGGVGRVGETGGGDGSETGTVREGAGKQQSSPGIGSNLTPGVRDNEENNNVLTT